MNCNCCNRRKRLFESFTTINDNINICAHCNDVLLKIRDDFNDNNTKANHKHIDELKELNKKSTPSFLAWFEDYCKKYQLE